MNKKEVYPWWNSLTKEERMEIYFKYFTTGTYDDCTEWWYNLDITEKIKVFDNWNWGEDSQF